MARQSDEDDNDALASLKLGSTIAARQLKYSLLLAVGLGLLIVAFRGYQDYRWLAEIYQQGNQRVTASNVPVAVQALQKRDLTLPM